MSHDLALCHMTLCTCTVYVSHDFNIIPVCSLVSRPNPSTRWKVVLCTRPVSWVYTLGKVMYYIIEVSCILIGQRYAMSLVILKQTTLCAPYTLVIGLVLVIKFPQQEIPSILWLGRICNLICLWDSQQGPSIVPTIHQKKTFTSSRGRGLQTTLTYVYMYKMSMTFLLFVKTR